MSRPIQLTRNLGPWPLWLREAFEGARKADYPWPHRRAAHAQARANRKP